DLAPIFASVDDRAFTDALENVYADIDRLGVEYDELDIHGGDGREPTPADVVALESLLAATNAVQEQLRRLNAFLYALTTTDSRDDRASARLVELQTRGAPLAPLAKRLGAWLAALGGPEPLAAQSLAVAEHEFMLRM